jgi:hypothetical protein
MKSQKKTALISVKPMGQSITVENLYEWKVKTEQDIPEIKCIYAISQDDQQGMIKVLNQEEFDAETVLQIMNSAMINISTPK